MTSLLFFFLSQESHIPKLITPAEKGRDLEARLLEAYVVQCQAEAQEGILNIVRFFFLKEIPISI